MIYFETDRLFIRSLSENDLDDFLDYRSDPEVVKWQGFGVWSETEARAFLLEQAERRIADDDQWTQFGVELKAKRNLIGDLAAQLHSDHSAHVGVTLKARYQRQGFAREALSGLINYLHETFRTNAVIGLTDARNTASIRLLESLHFKFEKEEHNVPYKGEFCTEYTYRLLL